MEGREWPLTNKIPNIWRWMRLGIGEEEPGAVDDFINPNESEQFPFCFPSVPKNYRLV